MRNREYRCVNGKIHVYESPRISISSHEFDAFGLEYDKETKEWHKVLFETATEAGVWVDECTDTDVYRLPLHLEAQALTREFQTYSGFARSISFPAFDEFSDETIVKAEKNIHGMVEFIKALETSNITAMEELEKAIVRINAIKKAEVTT